MNSVLIVNDDIEETKRLKDIIKAVNNFNIEVCHSVLDAMNRISYERFTFGFFNIQEGSQKTGVELIKFFKYLYKSSIVFVMSDEEKDILKEMQVLKHCDHCIDKPFSKKEIKKLFNKYLY
jgi:DNA-binding NtrC family response regulator